MRRYGYCFRGGLESTQRLQAPAIAEVPDPCVLGPIKSPNGSHGQVLSIRGERESRETISIIQIEHVLADLGIPQLDPPPSGRRQDRAVGRERQGQDLVVATAASDANGLRFNVPDLDRAA